MLYTDFLKHLKKCPFCDLSKKQIIKETDLSFAVVNLAPYHKHHFMVIPKRHIEKILDATDEENRDMLALIREGLTWLNALGYKSYSVLVREGLATTGGSIPHLHYHLIPDTAIGMLDFPHDKRVVSSEQEIEREIADFRKIIG